MKKILSIAVVLSIFLTVSVSICTAQSGIYKVPESAEIPTPVPEVKKIIEEIQTIYRLTIYYIYEDGTEAAGTHTEQLQAGENYHVESPVILNFTASEDLIEGTMPNRDMEYTVIYVGFRPVIIPGTPEKPAVTFFTIEDYETSLGLGQTMMNVGICIE